MSSRRFGRTVGWCSLLLIVGCIGERPTTTTPAETPLTATATYLSSEPPRSVRQATNQPAGAPPDGMVYVPGGETRIGSADGRALEQPPFWVRIRPFFMDEHPVTVAQFRTFVRVTHYKTQAEEFSDGGTFDDASKQWTLTKGACWHHPQGPDAAAPPDDHPVTQVSWNDAVAYATWAGKRLPTELEWEHAARNGRNSRTQYSFGNDLTVNGKALANTWNGTFPDYNANTDGFRLTSPVGHFGKTPLGLTDMAGNVWQWCANWRFAYADVANGLPTNGQERAMRGGSFLCEPGWCHGYRVSGRSFSTPETALMHVGFRCVKDLP